MNNNCQFWKAKVTEDIEANRNSEPHYSKCNKNLKKRIHWPLVLTAISFMISSGLTCVLYIKHLNSEELYYELETELKRKEVNASRT